MQVIVTFRHVEPSEGLRQYAAEKVQRVHKYLRRPIEAHVILSVLKHRHTAEVQVSARGLNINATEETGDLYSAIDLAMSKIERQVKKHAAKHKDHKGGDTVAAASPVADERRQASGLVRAQRMVVKPMSVDQALRQLKLAKNDFVLFRNAANDTFSVLYRRRDGNYGLIEPELS
jgi:putative sigma-54 modulation protein